MTSHDLAMLLQKMSLNDKLGQMMQLHINFYTANQTAIGLTGPLGDINHIADEKYNFGSILGDVDALTMIEIQTQVMQNSRHAIPALFMTDIIHGYRTIFPIPLALSATWEPDCAEECARVSAIEGAAAGIGVTFSPMADLTRDPRWGRVMEGAGEDPLLINLMSAAFVRGYQEESFQDKSTMAACIKHIAAYGLSEAGREYNTVDLSEGMLREYYLQGYKGAIDAGCALAMTSFNTVERVPATANVHLMRDILRQELGFSGVLISDFSAVDELIAHGVAWDGEEAAMKSVRAGLDIEMMSSHIIDNMPKVIEENPEYLVYINQAVERILELKNRLGLFENPFRGANVETEKQVTLCDAHRQIACKIAEKAPVLLKNENALPLEKTERLLLLGEFANSQNVMGWWFAQGKSEECVSLLEGMKKHSSNVHYASPQGGQSFEQWWENLQPELEQADKIIVTAGESQEHTGEGSSRANLDLDKTSMQILQKLKELEKLEKLDNAKYKTILLVFSGRPLVLTPWVAQCDAIMQAWFLGTESGNALANLLYGDVSPSGRLPMTFPRSIGQIPLYYNHMSTGRPKTQQNKDERYVSRYIDEENSPLFPFGYGLTYSKVEYKSPILCWESENGDGIFYVTVTIKNIGKHTVDETVQLYIKDDVASVVRPVKELKAFRKVKLDPGEETSVVFQINETHLKFYNAEGVYKSERGTFTLFTGSNCEQTSEATFFCSKHS